MSPIKEPCFFAPEVADVTARARELYDADAPALRRYLDGPTTEKRDHGIVLDWDDYLKLFKRVRDETAIGEASVAYLASPAAAPAIRARLPESRIVMMLRNPVDRLFSRFAAARERGEATKFERWVGERQAEGELRKAASGPIWIGRYAVHLQRYLASFPAEHVRVFLYDDFVRAPAAVLRELLMFLAVDPEYPIDTSRRHNVTLGPRWPALQARLRPLRRFVPSGLGALSRGWLSKPRVGPTADERAVGIRVYGEDIRELEALIGRDLSAWLSPSGR